MAVTSERLNLDVRPTRIGARRRLAAAPSARVDWRSGVSVWPRRLARV